MKKTAQSIEEYLENINEEHKDSFQKLRETMKQNLPNGFVEMLSYGMIGYVVPHQIYPSGYHCNPKLPLTFINIASQKNFISLYHMGLYADPKLMNWFVDEYSKRNTKKLDIGKSCIRFKKTADIPYDLLGELAKKMTPIDWIAMYESAFKNNKV